MRVTNSKSIACALWLFGVGVAVPSHGQNASDQPVEMQSLPVSGQQQLSVPASDSLDVTAEPRRELLTLRNTMLQMIERLVQQEVLSVEEAQAMIEQAEIEAAAEATRMASLTAVGPATQRVAYVPEIVKDELREQIMSGLRSEVVDDVMREAQEEAWGVPGALPAWISDIRWYSDVRVRGETVMFDDGNAQLFNFQAINEAGGIGAAGQSGLLNTTNDRDRLRGRIRLGLDMRISERWQAGLRVTSSNEGNPVSRNSTLGQANADFDAIIDLAYLNYRSQNFVFTGGRMPNPYVRTDLLWDNDLTFEGLALTGVLPFRDDARRSSAFLTVGAFPLEEVEFSGRDKWLYGGQLGLRLGFTNGGAVTAAASYYQFDNVSGIRNEPESELFDFTAPQFVQKGNTLFDIRNDADIDNTTSLFALASDFELLNGTLLLDSGPIMRFAGGRPAHLFLNADYVKNIGWDDAEIFERTQLAGIDERTEGYTVALGLGSPSLRRRGDWRVEAFFRHLQRDAVIDAFTDSEFHRGGTDAEGWGAEVRYGLSRNTEVRVNYLTANEIDGPPLGIDVLQLDIHTRF